MELGRKITSIFNFILDEIIPPFLRDQKWFMWPLQWLVFREKTRHFMSYKEASPYLSRPEIIAVYDQTSSVHLQRKTDTHPECLIALEKAVFGDCVLDAGCGRGFLAKKLASKFQITAFDFLFNPEMLRNSPEINFVCGDIEKLPFQKNSFDTVVCTHTLEHVFDLKSTMKDLRNIAKKRLIIVVPLQRHYKYTFDLHVQFFPYPHSFLIQAGTGKGKIALRKIHGDLLYIEDNP